VGILEQAMADFEAILGSTPQWLSDVRAKLQGGEALTAMKIAEQARDDYRNKGDKKGEGASLIMVAKTAFEVGSWDAGTKASSEALHSFQSEKNKLGEAAALLLVASASYLSGEFSDAVASAEDSALLAESAGSNKQLAYSKAQVAEAALAMLQTQDNADPQLQAKAMEAAQEAAVVLRDAGEQGDLAKVLSNLATAYLISGNSNMGLAKAKNAQRIYQAEMNQAGEAAILITLAKALQMEGSSDAAMQHLQDAAHLFANIGDQQGQAVAYGLMEEYQSQDLQERRDFTKRIMARFEKKDDGGIASHRLSGGRKTHFFMPPSKPVTLGLATTKFIGFMGRAATVAAPKASSGPAQNRFLLYNVSWN
jgi:tetratricopeptide (TPR) repeat protein